MQTRLTFCSVPSGPALDVVAFTRDMLGGLLSVGEGLRGIVVDVLKFGCTQLGCWFGWRTPIVAQCDVISGCSGSDTVALMRGRDVLTVSDFGGTLASKLTLVNTWFPRAPCDVISGSCKSTVEVGEGEEEGVETLVS